MLTFRLITTIIFIKNNVTQIIYTSAWYAIADKGDNNHQSALIYRHKIAKKYQLITSNYILDELYTLLLIHLGYYWAVDFKNKLDFLQQSEILEILWINEEIAEETWTIFTRFNNDKQWSFTDCSSYVLMKKYHINEVFTFDHHFQQMGFTCNLF